MSRSKNEKRVISMLKYQVSYQYGYRGEMEAEHWENVGNHGFSNINTFNKDKVKEYYLDPEILSVNLIYSNKEGNLVELLIASRNSESANGYLALLVEGILETDQKTIKIYKNKYLDTLFKAMLFVAGKNISINGKKLTPFAKLAEHQQLVLALLGKSIKQYKEKTKANSSLLTILLNSIKKNGNANEVFLKTVDNNDNNLAHLAAAEKDLEILLEVIDSSPNCFTQSNKNKKQPLELYQISDHNDDIFSLTSKLDFIQSHPSITHILKQYLNKYLEANNHNREISAENACFIINNCCGDLSAINDKINFNSICELALKLNCNDIVKALVGRGLLYLTENSELMKKLKKSSARHYVLPINHKDITESNIEIILANIPVDIKNQGKALVSLVKNNKNLYTKIMSSLTNDSHKDNILCKLTASLIILKSNAALQYKQTSIKKIIEDLSIYTPPKNYRDAIENIKSIVTEIKQCVSNEVTLSPYGELLSFIANNLTLHHGYEKADNSSTPLLPPPQIIHTSNLAASYYLALIAKQIKNITITQDIIANITKAFNGLTTGEQGKQIKNISAIIQLAIPEANLNNSLMEPLRNLINSFFTYVLILGKKIEITTQSGQCTIPELQYYKHLENDERKIEKSVSSLNKAGYNAQEQGDTGMLELVLGYKKMRRQAEKNLMSM